jgi:hypothetical protein
MKQNWSICKTEKHLASLRKVKRENTNQISEMKQVITTQAAVIKHGKGNNKQI